MKKENNKRLKEGKNAAGGWERNDERKEDEEEAEERHMWLA